MNKPLLLLFLGLLILPNAISASCGLANDDQLIFRISAQTNAHAELYNGTNYATEICYNTIFGSEYAGASPHSGNTILKASAATNAHVERADLLNYMTNIQYGDLVCTYNPNCIGSEVCVATISGMTNAHVATCTGPAPYATKICCSSVAASVNNPPDSIIDTPNSGQTITVGNSINFTGHGTDPDIGDTIAINEWTCATAIGSCPAIFPTNLEDAGIITFNTIGTYTISYRVQDNHGIWDPSPATRIITVNAPAGSGSYLRLTKIDVAPENFSGGAPPDFTTLDVTVKNFGDPTDASIGIKVFWATDFSMVDGTEFASALANCGSLDTGVDCTKSLETINVSSLAPGSYKLVIKAYADGVEQDSDSVFFVVIGTVPVPELGLVFIPLLAVSALAIMFFAGRSGKAKK